MNPVVVESTGCVDDYLKMRNLAGVAQRKSLAELLDTGCIHQMAGIIKVAPFLSTSPSAYYKGFVKAFVLADAKKAEQFGLRLPEHPSDEMQTTAIYVEVQACYSEDALKIVMEKRTHEAP